MMVPADMTEVMATERAAYETGWPSTAFERELTQNAMARYVVLREGESGRLAGFGGLWLMVEEAHVVTVAVLPEVRRNGYGAAIVHGLMNVAIENGMSVATLEVRTSNQAARALYGRYGFYEVGLRKRYYSDNHEDAVIMTTEDIQGEAYRARLAELAARLEAEYPGVVLDPDSVASATKATSADR
jgi:ribosomal-protein-alanine N-acetyltransferase